MNNWKRSMLLTVVLASALQLAGCFSCQSWKEMWGESPEDYPSDLVFFDKRCKPMAKASPEKPAQAPAPIAKTTPAPKSPCGECLATGYYPSEVCTVVKLEKNMPVEVAMNSEFNYTIEVINPSDRMLHDVVVTEHLAENFKLADTNPKAKVDGKKLTFEMGMLNPEQAKVITVKGMATSTGCLENCATVSYVLPTCASTNVIQPALKLVKTAPSSVLLCDDILVKFVVTNTGSGSAKDVKVEDILPAGLTTIDGKNTIAMSAGTLAAGQSKEYSTTLKAEKTGKYVNKAVATSATGLKAESETTTIVTQPILAITKTGPEKRYLGRSVEYEITVTNKGDADAVDLVIEDQLPANVQFVSATNGGRASAGKVLWNLGTLKPQASRTVQLVMMPQKVDILTNSATAKAECADSVEASIKTVVEGIPAILLEVVDLVDPVEVDEQTTYVITATNQGSAADTNIRITCTLEENHQYISSSGATRGTIEGNTVTFAPLPNLAPKAEATWRVVVKAVEAGDTRIKVTMNTDMLDRPVEETEATNLYD